jgi:hypothetical protein
VELGMKKEGVPRLWDFLCRRLRVGGGSLGASVTMGEETISPHSSSSSLSSLSSVGVGLKAKLLDVVDMPGIEMNLGAPVAGGGIESGLGFGNGLS